VADLLSIIVATYNWPDALDAVLHGLSRQSDRDFEVLVADDGSGSQTQMIVEDWRAKIGVDLKHVWHEDRGFRLAEIRNRAIAVSRGEICVFLDGDSIPLAGFVAAHRRLAAPGWFVAGNRVLLAPALTERVLRDRTMPASWSLAQWIEARRAGEINRIAPLLTLPLGPLRRLNARSWKGARGGNLAIRRSDLDRVDGFDAAFSGWGLEDSDIIVRLIRSGARRKDGRFATGVVHLWHPENDRSRTAENRARLDAVIRDTRVRALHGLSELAPDTRCAG
jgi:glycosyltransferase involved in cell wall biosynthesis